MTEPTTKRTAEDVLRDLAMYLGVGGYNDIGDAPFDPEKFDRKIRWGIDYFVKATVTRCADKVEEMSKRPGTRWGEVKAALQAISPETEALAKPASSPAPVRPIGNQGISDYQREIARNMAEGFAAWNAARQEALPSDEPASPPAGGDVEEREVAAQAALARIKKLRDQYADQAKFADVDEASLFRQFVEGLDRATLSQPTSAGREDGP